VASANNVRKALNLKEINAVRAELASYGYWCYLNPMINTANIKYY
jgi:hypothetical protein